MVRAITYLARWTFAVVTMLALTCSPLASAEPAQTDDPIAVEISSITPTLIGSTGTLSISGTLANTAGEPVDSIQVRLWRDATPLASGKAVAASLDPESGSAGASMTTAAASIDGTLAPGESREFSVHASLDAPAGAEPLYLNVPHAAYRVGVEVFGATASGGFERIGFDFGYVTYPADDAAVNLTTVVLLTHRPTVMPIFAKTPDEVYLSDDSLIHDLADDLADLVDYAATARAVLIDPLLYDEAQTLAQASTFYLLQDDGSFSSTSALAQGASVAAAWLSSVDALIESDSVTVGRTLYANPDIVAALDCGHEEILDQAAQTLPDDHPLADLPLAVVPYATDLNDLAVEKIRALNPAWVLAGGMDSALQADGQILYIHAESVDDPGDEPIGYFIAHTVIDAQSLGTVTMLIDDPDQLGFLTGLPEGFTQTDLASLLATPTDQLDAVAITPGGDDTSEQIDDRASTLAWLADAWLDLTTAPPDTVITDPSTSPTSPDTSSQLNRLIASAWSSGLTHLDDLHNAWLTPQIDALRTWMSDQSLNLQISNWVTTSKQENRFPASVTNNTDFPIFVKLHFDSDNPLRIDVPDSDVVQIDPHQTVSIQARPLTLSNGKVGVSAMILTPSGYGVGQSASFTITGTGSGKVAWLIIIASGIIFVAMSAARIRQIRRRNQ